MEYGSECIVPIIDAYAHVSLPRFLSAEDCLRLMDRHGIEGAVLSTAETCPDTLEMSRALVAHPDRFRVLGMPLGRDGAAIREAIRAQLESGFSGIRVPAALIATDPGLLEPIGEAAGITLAVGENGLGVAAALLADFLDRYPACSVIGGHYAGPADPALLDRDPAVGRLFAHPRFFVAFTRHRAMTHLPVDAWGAALVRRLGWERLIWGSEWPVALWRDESYRETLDWPLRFGPSGAALEAFRYGNARRLFFTGVAAPRPLAPEWDMRPLRRDAPVWLFPPSLDLDEVRHRRFTLAYESWGGEARGPYSVFLLSMVERGMRDVKPPYVG